MDFLTFNITHQEQEFKITIHDEIQNGCTMYFATYVNTELESYKKLKEFEKQVHYGLQIKDEKENVVYYKDSEKLIKDITLLFPMKKLKSQL